MIFSEIFEIFENHQKSQNFIDIHKVIFENFQKNRDFGGNFHILSIFSMDFLWISIFFDVLERGNAARYNKYYVYL